MREHVHQPFGASEAEVLAYGGGEVRAVVEARLRDGPVAKVRVLDSDAALVLVEVARVPCGVAVPDELSDGAVALYLVVRGRLARLPHAEAACDREVSGVVVLYDLVDPLPASPLGIVPVENHVHVGLKSLEVHCASPPFASLGRLSPS